MSAHAAQNYCQQARDLLASKQAYEFFDPILSLFGYSCLQNRIGKAIQYYTKAIQHYLIMQDYHKVVECHREIAYLQAKPVLALETLENAVNIVVEHNIELAGELAESVVARHMHIVQSKHLLRFYEVCSDYYWHQTLYRECVNCLYTLSTIYASDASTAFKCEKIYENIVYIYLTKLNKPNLALVACDTLLMLYCKLPDKIEFYDGLRTASKSFLETGIQQPLSKFVSQLYYISIIKQ